MHLVQVTCIMLAYVTILHRNYSDQERLRRWSQSSTTFLQIGILIMVSLWICSNRACSVIFLNREQCNNFLWTSTYHKHGTVLNFSMQSLLPQCTQYLAIICYLRNSNVYSYYQFSIIACMTVSTNVIPQQIKICRRALWYMYSFYCASIREDTYIVGWINLNCCKRLDLNPENRCKHYNTHVSPMDIHKAVA